MQYIEDILENLLNQRMYDITEIETTDFEILFNFFEKYQSNLLLTDKQKNLAIKILKKYQDRFLSLNFNYGDLLINPLWKTKSRIIDKRKRLYVKNNNSNQTFIWINFPWEFKDIFDQTNFKNSVWDSEEGARRFHVFEVDLTSLYNFCCVNNFQIDNSFYDLYSGYEESMLQENNFLPRSIVQNNHVELINACDEAAEFWEKYKKDNYADDLLLAKSMGFNLINPDNSIIEKIVSSTSMQFWMYNLKDFFHVCDKISGKIVIILSERIPYQKWLDEFINIAELSNYNINQIKVCFREKNDKNKSFNQWIKQKSLGGEIKDGKIYIFSNRPAKWIFKLNHEIKLIATNNTNIPTDYITKEWFKNNPVIYIGKDKPTNLKEEKFVDL